MDRGVEAYHLQLCDVLLPPEIRLMFWPHIRREVVTVHEHVDESVYKTQQG